MSLELLDEKLREIGLVGMRFFYIEHVYFLNCPLPIRVLICSFNEKPVVGGIQLEEDEILGEMVEIKDFNELNDFGLFSDYPRNFDIYFDSTEKYYDNLLELKKDYLTLKLAGVK